MRFFRLANKNGALTEAYESEIVRRIRERYSLNQELAILRQRDAKQAEFEEYNTYVEECKNEVKEEIEKLF